MASVLLFVLVCMYVACVRAWWAWVCVFGCVGRRGYTRMCVCISGVCPTLMLTSGWCAIPAGFPQHGTAAIPSSTQPEWVSQVCTTRTIHRALSCNLEIHIPPMYNLRSIQRWCCDLFLTHNCTLSYAMQCNAYESWIIFSHTLVLPLTCTCAW